MVCDFLLCQLGADHFGLRMKEDIASNSKMVFGKYIVFSKAQINEDNPQWQTFACWGPQAREQLLSILTELPQEQYQSVLGTGFAVVQIDTLGTQFEFFIDHTRRPELIEQLGAEIALSDESVWQHAQIRAGLGRIRNATVETFIPQMLNYDITGHVNFTKGCYTGQEVVARMHYRGKPKRRMYLASLPEQREVEVGCALYSGESSQSVGNVVNSAADPLGGLSLLVVATTAGIEQGLHLDSVSGPLLNIDTQPYSLEKL